MDVWRILYIQDVAIKDLDWCLAPGRVDNGGVPPGDRTHQIDTMTDTCAPTSTAVIDAPRWWTESLHQKDRPRCAPSRHTSNKSTTHKAVVCTLVRMSTATTPPELSPELHRAAESLLERAVQRGPSALLQGGLTGTNLGVTRQLVALLHRYPQVLKYRIGRFRFDKLGYCALMFAYMNPEFSAGMTLADKKAAVMAGDLAALSLAGIRDTMYGKETLQKLQMVSLEGLLLTFQRRVEMCPSDEWMGYTFMTFRALLAFRLNTGADLHHELPTIWDESSKTGYVGYMMEWVNNECWKLVKTAMAAFPQHITTALSLHRAFAFINACSASLVKLFHDALGYDQSARGSEFPSYPLRDPVKVIQMVQHEPWIDMTGYPYLSPLGLPVSTQAHDPANPTALQASAPPLDGVTVKSMGEPMLRAGPHVASPVPIPAAALAPASAPAPAPAPAPASAALHCTLRECAPCASCAGPRASRLSCMVSCMLSLAMKSTASISTIDTMHTSAPTQRCGPAGESIAPA